MSNYSRKTDEDVRGENRKKSPDGESNINRELFKRALSDAMDLKMQEIDEKIKNVELPKLSKDYKIRMNRLFSECTGGSFLPFLEEYNL